MAAQAPKTQGLPLLPLRVHPRRSSTLVWGAGRFVFAYDVARGEWEQRRKELHSDTIRALDATRVVAGSGAESGEKTRWLSAGDDKLLMISEEQGGEWTTTSKLSHQKKITAAVFDKDGRAVFADRFGDVYRWAVSDDTQAELLSSHFAIVTALAFTASGRFLIAGDNHEKVRISCYPQAAEIRSFCLGHTSQITALATTEEGSVLSASADGTLRLWSLDGEELRCWDVGSAVSSLSCSEATAAVGCEAPSQGLRRIALGGAEQPVQTLLDEAPQAVCARPSDGAIFWVDRRGHLRTPPSEGGSAWGDVFDGEDLAPALVAFAKGAGDDAEEGGGEGGDGEDDKGGGAQKKKRS
eukprot:TRINITY_DN55123_c0_g1_i1.p1 TRINITY_DN55123_c0_g1~~TRINITY_DN55123_c0_g1_i1.p1  ORF type:complete len:354 (-),score=69.11 TRINITY_DN55123_c0_g1_i1:18-1079(-)